MTNTQADNPHEQSTLELAPGPPGSPPPDFTEMGTLISVNPAKQEVDPPAVLGQCAHYELLAELGRGGMGVVYKARDTRLRRLVALKMVLAGRLASEEDLTRFHTEAEAAARLEHPHIVTVYEVGEYEGQHYLSMKFIEGETLGQRLARGPLPCHQAARYIQVVARAVHHAHTHGILHRDLKPSNILIDRDDQPHVTDFGLAKRLGDNESRHTASGSVLGTPSYMSPEQAGGKTRDLGPATDVYSLGAVLYELLTGRPPFRAATPLDTVLQVIQNEPVPPRLLNPSIDADLETICLKCLEKDPVNRYHSALELADDLLRYLNGDSIQARSFNILDRITRTLERSQHDVAFHTWSGMLLLLAVIVLVVHTAVFILAEFGAPNWVLMTARFSQFVLIALIFWNNRGNNLLPRSMAERELWTIWLGYLAAYGAAILAVRSLVGNGVITGGIGAPERWDNLILYPISSLLSGLAFFVMGANYWGRCYAIGLAFMGLAVVSTWSVELAPLLFGILWGVALGILSLRLRHLGRRAAENKEADSTPTTGG